MSSNIASLEPIFASSKKVSQIEVSKALATLGFGAWNELEPGKQSLLLKDSVARTFLEKL